MNLEAPKPTTARQVCLAKIIFACERECEAIHACRTTEALIDTELSHECNTLY